MNPKTALKICFAFGLFKAAALNAAPLVINNPSFEAPVLADDGFTFTSAPVTNGVQDWTVFMNGYGVYNPVDTQYTFATDTSITSGVPIGGAGRQNLFVFASVANSTTEFASQTLSSTFQAQTTYTLTVAIGNRFDLTMNGYTIGLWSAGGTFVASASAAAEIGGLYYTPGGALISEGEFGDAVLTFTTGLSDPFLGEGIQIRLFDTTGPGGGQVNFDDVRLDAVTVPEPSALVLATTALASGMLVRSRRRRANTR